MTTSITVAGWTTTNKVPGFYGRVISPSGRASAGGFLFTLLLIGSISSSGTLTANTEVADVFSVEDANTKAGPGSELSRMAAAALRIPGVRVKIASPAVSGGAAATFTITITVGTAAVSTYTFRIAGKSYSVVFSASDTVTTAAGKLKAIINADNDCPFTADNSSGVLTGTCKTLNARGNNYYIAQDTSQLTSGGFAAALAGGTPVTGGIVPCTGGAGTEDVTTLTTTLTPGLYDYIASAVNDATNLGRFKTYMQAKSAPTEMRNEQLIFGTNGTLSAATTLSTTTATVNFTQFEHLWDLYGETHPSENAAAHAADRCTNEISNPSPRYMNRPINGSAPHSQTADIPTNAIADTALNNGVSPVSTINGIKCVVRAVTTYSLVAAGVNDYRCLDVANVTMSFYVLRSFALIWNTDVSVNYQYVIDDPDPESAAPVPDAAIYPSLWNGIMLTELRKWEKLGWVYDVSNHLPETIYDSSTRRLLFNCPVFATPGLYQIGGNVRQVAA